MKKPTEYNLSKSSVECYKLRHPSGMYWADITIDANGNTGRISISSDYGNWAHYWGACGESFKQFLTSIDMWYAARKFGADNWLDSEGTIKQWKRCVIEERRKGYVSEEKARAAFDEILEMEGEIYSSRAVFESILWLKSNLTNFFDQMPHINEDVSPQFKAFWNGPWRVFIDQIKTETNKPVGT